MKILKKITISLCTALALAVSAYGACSAAIDFGSQNLTSMKLGGDMNANSNKITVTTHPIFQTNTHHKS